MLSLGETLAKPGEFQAASLLIDREEQKTFNIGLPYPAIEH
jgi:hypothetical protein